MNNETEFTEDISFPSVSVKDAADRIAGAKNALIICHDNPDGDTVGSASALLVLIRALGGDGKITCTADIPKRLRFLLSDGDFLPKCEILSENGLTSRAEEFDLIFSVDVASPTQLGDYKAVKDKIGFMLDHHSVGEPYAPHYIDPMASAAGEIVFEIYSELKNRGALGELPDASRKIYAAIISDTGSFKFSNTTPRTHIIASELVREISGANDGGADTTDIARSLFGQRTLKELTAQMLAIRSLTFYENGKLGAVLFTRELLDEYGLSDEEIGNVVDTPRGVEGVLVGISLRQLADDRESYKVSSRANAEVDCASVCARFGGGGHVRAAGCVIRAESPEDALKTAAEAFSEAIREYTEKNNVNT